MTGRIMSFSRTKRVELAQFSPEWSESYILVKTSGLQAVLNLQIQISRKEKEVKRISELLSTPSDKSDEYEEEIFKLSEQIVEMTLGIIKDRFVGGMIFDNETQALRPIVKEELSELDREVSSHIIQEILGSAPKA